MLYSIRRAETILKNVNISRETILKNVNISRETILKNVTISRESNKSLQKASAFKKNMHKTERERGFG